MRRKLAALGLALMTPAMALAGTNLAGDAGFDAFPEVCMVPTDLGCWDVEGSWASIIGQGNDQPDGSGPPAAACFDNATTGAEGPEGADDTCLLAQCVDISAFPAGTLFEYGFAHNVVFAIGDGNIQALAVQAPGCNGPTLLRDEVAFNGPVGTWATTSGAFASEAGDQSILLLLTYIVTPGVAEGLQRTIGRDLVLVDDGFLVAAESVNTLEIPTVSTVGLAALALLLLAAMAMLLRRRVSR